MSEGVTREEIRAMIDVQAKNVEQMVMIASSLRTIADQQEKIVARLYNGMAKDIAENVEKSLDVKFDILEANCGVVVKDVKTIKGDTFWLKIIIGGASLMFAIGMLLNQTAHWWFHAPKGQP